jgi:hypothetical protein
MPQKYLRGLQRFTFVRITAVLWAVRMPGRIHIGGSRIAQRDGNDADRDKSTALVAG